MKLLSISIILLTIILSGCSLTPKPILYEEATTYVSMEGSFNPDIDIVSVPQNIGILLKKSAKIAKSKGIKYITFDSIEGVPPMITNFSDLIRYCYPKNNGPSASDWKGKSSSLEQKCNFKAKTSTLRNEVSMKVLFTDKNFIMGTWSVDQILEDKYLQKFIDIARKDSSKKSDIKNIEFKSKIINKNKIIDNLE